MYLNPLYFILKSIVRNTLLFRLSVYKNYWNREGRKVFLFLSSILADSSFSLFNLSSLPLELLEFFKWREMEIKILEVYVESSPTEENVIHSLIIIL